MAAEALRGPEAPLDSGSPAPPAHPASNRSSSGAAGVQGKSGGSSHAMEALRRYYSTGPGQASPMEGDGADGAGERPVCMHATRPHRLPALSLIAH